ncbi:MAG: hypothetical protein R2734_09105 [Nocardioides sp.]
MDLLEASPAGLIEGSRLHLLQQLADHAADPHHLRRLLDQVGELALAVVVGLDQGGGIGLTDGRRGR